MIQKNLRDHERNKQETLAEQEEGYATVMVENDQNEEEHAKYQVATATTTDVPPSEHINYYPHHPQQTPTPPTPPTQQQQQQQYPQYSNETVTPGMPMPTTQHY